MKPAKLTYTNHRGETAQRIITPLFMLYGETEWHPEPQWLIHAFDHEKREVSDFALKDFGYPAPAAQPTIKALEWKKSALLTMWQKQLIVRVTDTVLGRFSVCQAAATVSGPLPPAWIGPDGVHHEVADVEAGVAAVEAHYQLVIRSALQPSPTPVSAPAGAWDELCKRTFAVQHNPRCPSPFLVRLPGEGSGSIDMKPYGDVLGLVKHQTSDILGFGKTLEEAALAALRSPAVEGK